MKFNKVSLDREIRNINKDGHPLMRRCDYHEILLSFTDDLGREYFEKFWEEKGAELLAEYMKEDGVSELFINKK